MNENINNQIRDLKDFLILWGSQSLSALGSSMTSYALLIWVYRQKSSTMSVSLLAVCTYLPAILVSFMAGVFVDRHDKRKIMLVCDSIAALGTITVLVFMLMNRLEVWHIYLINIMISIMNTFETSANAVTVSKLVPRKYYLKIGGLQSISSSIVGILSPTAATACMAFGNISTVFIFDIFTFVIAFFTLLFVIRIPLKFNSANNKNNSFVKDFKMGFAFIKENGALLHFILIFTAINLVAYIGGGGITTTVTAMIMSRIANGQTVLGAFSTAVAAGTLVGGILVTFMKPPKSRVKTIFLSCGISFIICDLSLGLSRNPWIWITANFIGSLPLSLLNSNQSVILRTTVPIEIQGRVFSVRDTLQYCTIPLGYLLGGVLADYVFEPFMQAESVISNLASLLVGTGNGTGIAVMFIFTGITGGILSLYGVLCKKLRILD